MISMTLRYTASAINLIIGVNEAARDEDLIESWFVVADTSTDGIPFSFLPVYILSNGNELPIRPMLVSILNSCNAYPSEAYLDLDSPYVGLKQENVKQILAPTKLSNMA
ncbi:hypothetical protein RHSIM_Rhsim03G0138900 [Rhododendron simsii]|uniref:Uncharacterized protein n=1 Tax=Rhododendron simsii TaxID=118357 RepID=A0A834LUV1_RHOSS|nr:hypothetical protein RHSIM_Rhsim03G0138900 [Rhododendron simsii]